MAKRQFSRSRPGRPRSSGGNLSAQPTHQGPTAGVMNPDGTYPSDEGLRQLALLALRLLVIYGTAVSAELALRQQAAEQDPEIADSLRAGVCDPLAVQIREVEIVVHRFRNKASEPNP